MIDRREPSDMAAVLTEIGRRLKERRAALGLTQREVAERMGVTPARYRHMEMALRDHQLSSLISVAKALEINLDLLVKGVG